MPIRFRCQRCNQLLGIASRKAGTEIECPKCGVPQSVPGEEAAAAALAMSQGGVRPDSGEKAAEMVVYDDVPTAIESPRRGFGGNGPLSALEEGLDNSLPPGLILYRRRTLYLQGVLFLLLAAGALAAGYFIGRGDASFELARAHEEASRELVLVEGRVVFDPGNGTLEGDEAAAIIFLPHGKLPEQTLSIDGLRPRDPPPGDDEESVQAIEALGGGYARADASGAFSLVLPDAGTYRCLMISRRTARPEDDNVDELDEDEIRQYFYRAASLIHRQKYRWSVEEITVDGDSIAHSFGLDGV